MRHEKPSNTCNLYVPLPGVWLPGALSAGRRYHNWLHLVHKPLHTLAPGESSCRPFTNCLQTVALRKKMQIYVPASPRHYLTN